MAHSGRHPLAARRPKKRLGFVFLTEEAPGILSDAGQFYLWEGKVIGEATVSSEV